MATEHIILCRVRQIVYSCVPRPDAKTSRLRHAVEAAGGLWRDVLALNEADLAQLVRADKVDILVDLTGHTANNRLGTFAMRPAPIQVIITRSYRAEENSKLLCCYCDTSLCICLTSSASS